MTTTKKNSNGVKNSSSLAVNAVNDFFKTAKSVHAFNGEVLSVDIYNFKMVVETKDYWIQVYTDDIDILLKRDSNFLTSEMVDEIWFIRQNRQNIISLYKNAKKQAA